MKLPVLRDRLFVGLGLAALLVWMLFRLPVPLMLPVLLAVCALAVWEFYDILAAGGMPHYRLVGLLGGLAIVAATWNGLRTFGGGGGEWIVLFGVVAAVLVRQFLCRNGPNALQPIAGTLMGVMYVPFLFNFFTRLLLAWGDASGRLLLFYLLLVVKLTDTGAYFIGCSFGRRKLIPRISPAKTWEGFLGGAAVGVAASLAFFWISGGRLGAIDLRWYDALVLAVVLAVAGVLGDLAESVMKRAAGVKDSGRVAGMGGLLDMMDSLLFAAPALYAYVYLFLQVAH